MPLEDDGPLITTAITSYYLNGMRVAQSRDGVVTWFHADHLSSATRLTDVNGLEVRRLAYTAFGEHADNQGTGDDPTYTYTNKERDTTGLYYYGARYYDPVLCRFIIADTVYDAGPQGLNRYSYALNNPMIYRDPTGHNVVVISGGINPKWHGWENPESMGQIKELGEISYYIDRKLLPGRLKPELRPSHDKNERNFVYPAIAEIQRRKQDLRPGERIEWHVEISSYATRAQNEGKDIILHIEKIKRHAKDLGVDLIWFETKEELVRNLNSIPGRASHRKGVERISWLTYFGHGKINALILNPGDKTQNLTSDDIKNGKILKIVFTDDAIVVSYACRSATPEVVEIQNHGVQITLDSFRDVWGTEIGTDFYGVDGRTNYKDADDGIVTPSQDENAEWVPAHPPERKTP
jgi:RHS repeat-associated protein